MTDRYLRSVLVEGFGAEGQERLARSTVAVVGCGGLGSASLSYLAAAGVGRLVIADNDTVSLSNLQRQVLYTTAQIGCDKVLCAADRLRAINPNVDIVVHNMSINVDNFADFASGADIIIDCTDNYATRYTLSMKSKESSLPFIYATAEGMGGQVALFTPRHDLYYHDLYPEPAEQRPVVGVMPPIPGIIGAIEASEAIKYLSGMGDTLEGRLLVADMKRMSFDIFELGMGRL